MKMKDKQLISLPKKKHRELVMKIEDLAKKENRTISDEILSLLEIGYQEYINRAIDSTTPKSVVSLFAGAGGLDIGDRKSTRLNSSHVSNSYAVFCLKREKDLV